MKKPILTILLAMLIARVDKQGKVRNDVTVEQLLNE
jgi:hypothetical protein